MLNSYYLMDDGEKLGPFSHTELMDQGLHPETLLLSPVTNEWQSAAYLPEFYDYFYSQSIYYPIASIRASFWWRLLAYLIDYALLLLLVMALAVVWGLFIRFTGIGRLYVPDKHDLKLKLTLALAMIMYHSGFEATRMQGSIGKTICKLKVVTVDGRRLKFPNALGRNAAKIISSLVCGMGFLNILWDNKRQGWHDQMAKTYVIRHS